MTRPDPERWRRLLEGSAGEAFGALYASGRSGDAGPADPVAAQGGGPIGPYTVLHRLGEGGAGVVFAARQAATERRVALKILRAGVFADERQRGAFQREIRSLARLAHPGIAAIYEAGRTDDGLDYFTMELVDGDPLDVHLAGRPRPDMRAEVDARLALFLELCDAVSHAHQRGVIHLDLKPSNVLVTRAPASVLGGAPVGLKVLDFGVARLSGGDGDGGRTLAGPGLFGTLATMSPEQAAGDASAVDVRSDIYSLGVLLYEMLTGAYPVDVHGLPIHEAVAAIRTREPGRAGDRSRLLRGDLEIILGKALQKDPAQRYQSAAALAEDVQRFRDDLPILGRAPSTAYQLRKIVRRHRLPIVLLGMVGLSLVAAVGGTGFGLVRARKAETAARADAAAAEQTAAFLEKVFRVSEPGEARGNAVTARELLDQAVASIGADLDDQPRLQGRLLAAMGNAYRNLGLYRDARPLLEQAIILQRATLAPDDQLLAANHSMLASLLRRLEDYPAAQEHYEAALAVRERALPPDHPDIGQAVAGLANLAVDRADYDAARILYDRALGILARSVGTDHPRYAAMLANQAVAEWNAGNADAARTTLAQVVAIQRRVLPADDLDLAWSLSTLALFTKGAGRATEALALSEEALAVQEAALGPGHTDVAATLGVIADLRSGAGDHDGAIALHQRAVAIWAEALGTGSAGYAMALDNLAQELGQGGRTAEAIAASERAGAVFAANLAPDHPAIATNATILARLHLDAGKPALARPLLERAYALRADAQGPQGVGLVIVLESLARADVLEGRSDAARNRLDQALAIAVAAGDSTLHAELLDTRAALTADSADLR
ncbi:MAG TPA: serine/threonine-protein kinase [Candidatus Krumholzibacteria bacterium]|nr:serine/threonine-protein kinase [Candidatus Krumholzibacteria bacterium]